MGTEEAVTCFGEDQFSRQSPKNAEETYEGQFLVKLPIIILHEIRSAGSGAVTYEEKDGQALQINRNLICKFPCQRQTISFRLPSCGI
jgi:hypothetical protein